jgi:hypothetical protein
VIPAEAVEAAAKALAKADLRGGFSKDDYADALTALEAAAPYMPAKAKAEALIEAAEVAERGEGGGHDSGECDDWGAWLRARAAAERSARGDD